eukprot:scaffold155174_cov33-Tisochrysis_lutea.AAC.5
MGVKPRRVAHSRTPSLPNKLQGSHRAPGVRRAPLAHETYLADAVAYCRFDCATTAMAIASRIWAKDVACQPTLAWT